MIFEPRTAMKAGSFIKFQFPLVTLPRGNEVKRRAARPISLKKCHKFALKLTARVK